MIYLDNSATTRPFDSVIEKMGDCMRNSYYNASAAYKPAVDLDKEIRGVRQLLARQLGAREDEVYFTSGGTESDNLAILGCAQSLRRPMNFVCSGLEHPAVLETMNRVTRMGHEVRELPVSVDGRIDLGAAEAVIDENTAFVSCMQVSNETGAIQPVEALSRLAKGKNKDCIVHVDGVQGFMRVPMHMSRMGVDIYALSGHKIHGPKGIGAVVIRKGVRITPQQTGGGQEKGMRSGTYNTPAILGLGVAVGEMAARQADVAAMKQMKARLWKLLAPSGMAMVNGPLPEDEASAPHVLSLSFEGMRGEVMRNALEGEGILVSTGSACASHKQKTSGALKAMGLTGERADGTVRVSLGLYNTMEEMEQTAAAMLKIAGMLSRYRRR